MSRWDDAEAEFYGSVLPGFVTPGSCLSCGNPGPCQCGGDPKHRPAEPESEDCVWYRGWEVGFDQMAHDYTQRGWRAYKGGVDLDAPTADGATFEACLDDVDEQEDD